MVQRATYCRLVVHFTVSGISQCLAGLHAFAKLDSLKGSLSPLLMLEIFAH